LNDSSSATKPYRGAKKSPMPTQCNPNLLAFAPAERRPIVASLDRGAITSDAGALLLGATDRVLGLTCRLAACFKDSRDPAYTSTRSRRW
jgi:hypothetical protein